MTAEEIQKQAELARAFAAKHIRELAAEVLEWKASTTWPTLRDGKFRELADMCRVLSLETI